MRTSINSLHVEWVKAGSKKEGAQYEELGEAVFIYIQRIIKREFAKWFRVLQEDAVQEVALEVFKDIQKYNPIKADFEQWVYGVTCHTCIDLLRQRKNQNEWPLLDHEAVANYNDYSAKRQLEQLRAQLTEDENEFIDYKLNGTSNKDIAEALGTSEGYVEIKWDRLCKKLRTL